MRRCRYLTAKAPEIGPRILITGCSCGGKSTLLAALAARGYDTVPEPGRRIIAAARSGTEAGTDAALPWIDPVAFAQQAVAMSRADLARHGDTPDPVFFDRGLIDAATALQHAAGVAITTTLGQTRPYTDPVFLAPPWPALFENDSNRRHGFDAAVAEYHRITAALQQLGYRVITLTRTSVSARATLVLQKTAAA